MFVLGTLVSWPQTQNSCFFAEARPCSPLPDFNDAAGSSGDMMLACFHMPHLPGNRPPMHCAGGAREPALVRVCV